MTCDLTQREMIRGDSDVFTVTFKDSTGTPIDITGWEVRYTVRENYAETSIVSDTNAAISSLATITIGTDGVAEFNVTPSQTQIDPKEYRYDIQYKDALGVIKSIPSGILVVSSDVTRDQ